MKGRSITKISLFIVILFCSFTDDDSISSRINPVNSSSIETDDANSVLIVVKDILGRENYSKIAIIAEGNNHTFVSDPEKKLQPGLYKVIASSHNNKLYNQKVIVQ